MSGEVAYLLLVLAAAVPVAEWCYHLESSGEVDKGVLFGPAFCWLLALWPLTLVALALWLVRRVWVGSNAAQGAK